MKTPSCGTRLIVGLVACVLQACDLYPSGAAQSVGVDVQPATTAVAPGGQVKFAAVVTGTVNTKVAWTILETGGGAIDSTGLYTAPTTAGTFHVRASSPVDSTAVGTATVTVTQQSAITVTVTPTSGAIHSCETLTFRSSVTGTSDTSVNWTVQEGATGGMIDAAGVYTAPNVAGTYHVVATSRADPTKSAVAQVNVTDLVLAVTISPSTVTLSAGGTAQFTSTVTTSCGTFTSAPTIAGAGLASAR
jgi:hypothetical protein